MIVGAGTYRETLTTDVHGTSGSPITYIGDEGGTLTDGVGGMVRITGSNNDLIGARSPIVSVQHNYRHFRGFHLDTPTANGFSCGGVNNLLIDQCVIQSATNQVLVNGAAQANNIIRRCLFLGGAAAAVQFTHGSTVNDSGNVIENCIVLKGGGSSAFRIDRIGGVTVRNCWVMCFEGVRVQNALASGQVVTVNNCIFYGCGTAVRATVATELIEDYNTFWGNGTDRVLVNVGANSQVYAPLFELPLLTLGVQPLLLGKLMAVSGIKALAGIDVPAGDFYDVDRESPSSWGAVQFGSELPGGGGSGVSRSKLVAS